VVILLALAAVTVMLVAGCTKGPEKEKGAPAMSTEDAIRVMDAHVKELMAIPGVVGVAVGALDDGKPCIQVLVARETPELRARVPNKIEGYAIMIEVTGEIKPMSGDSAR
jgi:hypothetical protein